MSQKLTIEEIKNIFGQFGLTVLDTESKGIGYKYNCVDKDGYKYSRSASSAKATLRKGKKIMGIFLV